MTIAFMRKRDWNQFTRFFKTPTTTGSARITSVRDGGRPTGTEE